LTIEKVTSEGPSRRLFANHEPSHRDELFASSLTLLLSPVVICVLEPQGDEFTEAPPGVSPILLRPLLNFKIGVIFQNLLPPEHLLPRRGFRPKALAASAGLNRRSVLS
jgi:hypothetical protein